MSVQKEVLYKNKSPWLYQLRTMRRSADILSKDTQTQVAIIGGGIAGIVSAFFLLKDTRSKVVLVEATRIAHGATGHNAGQIVSYFERPFADIVREYGLTMATRGQKEILSAWQLLDSIYAEVPLTAQFSHFMGYAGFSTLEQVCSHLENKRIRSLAKLSIEEAYISDKAPFLTSIPKKYKKLYSIIPHAKILSLLEAKKEYYAAFASKKGCLNSALFTEELAGYLLKTYPRRFRVYEHTPVTTITLLRKVHIMTKQKKTIIADKIILCTNGFEQFNIHDAQGTLLNIDFHNYVRGVVGYMAGYIDQEKKKPSATSYFPPASLQREDPYFYVTRRDFELTTKRNDALVCIGGPEVFLDDHTTYKRNRSYFLKREKEIDAFVKKTLTFAPPHPSYRFHWHGLMGYTRNGLRAIGAHPLHPTLLLNLGCNGVGILPSIYGGYRIARLVAGIKLAPSIFDVRL